MGETYKSVPDGHVPSVVFVMGESSSHCGYCGRTEESSVSYGMHAERMSVYTYQQLIDRYVYQ